MTITLNGKLFDWRSFEGEEMAKVEIEEEKKKESREKKRRKRDTKETTAAALANASNRVSSAARCDAVGPVRIRGLKNFQYGKQSCNLRANDGVLV